MKKIKGEAYSCICYALEGPKGILLIDSGDGSIKFDFTPALTILTHNHYDHTKGVRDWKEVYLHQDDFTPNSASHIPGNAEELKFNHITWGEWNLKILHTPGHTPGSICLYEETKQILFSGDTLFKNGVGRTDIGGNENDLKDSLKLIKGLNIKELCPGHE